MVDDPRIGTEVAGYRIDAAIGRGGMSKVYLAFDLRLERRVALKIISPELNENQSFRERFVRESRVAARLDHPNIIPVFDAGEADGVLFIAMRYVESTDLRAMLKREGTLDAERAVSLLAQVAGALDAAHVQGLVHRDIKPANILIAAGAGSADHAYLSDFGLTKQALATSGFTTTGQFMGTVEYAAPEQIRGQRLDGRADLYALGCVLFECLTGEPPFRKDDEVAVIYAHLTEEPPAVSARRPELTKSIDAVVATALAKTPEARYGSCLDLMDAAREALGAGGGGVDRRSGGPAGPMAGAEAERQPTGGTLAGPAPARAKARRSRRERVVTAVAAALMLVLLLPVVAVAHGRRTAAVSPASSRPASFGGSSEVPGQSPDPLNALTISHADIRIEGPAIILTFSTYSKLDLRGGGVATWDFDIDGDVKDGCEGYDLVVTVDSGGASAARYAGSCGTKRFLVGGAATSPSIRSIRVLLPAWFFPRPFRWRLSTLTRFGRSSEVGPAGFGGTSAATPPATSPSHATLPSSTPHS